MAHFKSGTQHMAFENSNCFNCLNYRSVDNKISLLKVKDNDGEGGFGCTLMDMHLLHQGELDKKWLDMLISDDFVCPMRLTMHQARMRLNEYQQRLELENNQFRSGLNQESLFTQSS